MDKTIMISGGFDPLHSGHINLMRNASKLGRLIVILNSDDWLVRKKGFFFQSWEERAAIIRAMSFVFDVVSVDDSDETVCSALEIYKPDYFGNGGDRKPDNTPEVGLCGRLGIDLVWNLGEPSTDVLHSSHIIRKSKVQRDWGTYEVLAEGPWYQVKRLLVKPGGKTSLQYHTARSEYLFSKDFQLVVKPNQVHQIVNNENEILEIIEVQTGNVREDDIVRIQRFPL